MIPFWVIVSLFFWFTVMWFILFVVVHVNHVVEIDFLVVAVLISFVDVGIVVLN